MPKRRTKADWLAIIQTQQQSGLTPPLFCQREKITLQSFYARRCELRDKCHAPTTSAFIQVETRPSAAMSSSTTVLRWEQATLSVPLNCDPLWLAQLLKALST